MDDVPQEPEHGGSTRLLKIYEPDLAELERLLPQICETANHHCNSPRLRTQIRQVQDIIKHVRWNYLPHDDIEIIPAE